MASTLDGPGPYKHPYGAASNGRGGAYATLVGLAGRRSASTVLFMLRRSAVIMVLQDLPPAVAAPPGSDAQRATTHPEGETHEQEEDQAPKRR
jgi:hypothetical protein